MKIKSWVKRNAEMHQGLKDIACNLNNFFSNNSGPLQNIFCCALVSENGNHVSRCLGMTSVSNVIKVCHSLIFANLVLHLGV